MLKSQECEYCQNIFSTDRLDKKYCTQKCQRKAHRKRRDKKHRKYKNDFVQKICIVCSRQFYIHVNHSPTYKLWCLDCFGVHKRVYWKKYRKSDFMTPVRNAVSNRIYKGNHYPKPVAAFLAGIYLSKSNPEYFANKKVQSYIKSKMEGM